MPATPLHGKRIVIGVGSRGIDRIVDVVRATAAFVRAARPVQRLSRAVLARLGKPLDQTLDPGDPVPAYGEDSGEQRRYSKPQYNAMWEAEQGHKLTPAEQTTIDLGCIGITINNLSGGAGPAPAMDEVYSTFAKAHQIVTQRNAGLERYTTKPWVLFGMHFWSNQDPDDTKREKPNPTAFRPDATGKVDMTGYEFRERPGYTNFDYGFWDDVSQSHWHANHYDAGPSDPMIVHQSTRAKFSHVFEEEPWEFRFGYPDFDREVFGVARAKNYDPSKAAKPKLTSKRWMGPDGVTPNATIEKVFRGKRTLGAGSPVGAIRLVQEALRDLAKYDLGTFGPAKDGVDGKYGDKTRAAVKQFKADENLGNRTSGNTDRGVIYRLDELFPPVPVPVTTPPATTTP
jgi:hypothetical protein